VAAVSMLANERMDPLFEATVQATQEAILNSMLAADTMTGADGIRVFALPHARLQEALKKYGRK
jgi:L-aminopeptidase/D-esterase-like protein